MLRLKKNKKMKKPKINLFVNYDKIKNNHNRKKKKINNKIRDKFYKKKT